MMVAKSTLLVAGCPLSTFTYAQPSLPVLVSAAEMEFIRKIDKVRCYRRNTSRGAKNGTSNFPTYFFADQRVRYFLLLPGISVAEKAKNVVSIHLRDRDKAFTECPVDYP